MYGSFLSDIPGYVSDMPGYDQSPSSPSSWSGTSALSLTMPAHLASLDPSRHALDSPDAFRLADRFPKRASFSQRLQQQLQLWEEGKSWAGVGRGKVAGRLRRQQLPAELDEHNWESWEAKWSRLLEAEEAAERANAQQRSAASAAKRRMQEEERKAAKATLDAAVARAAELQEIRRQSD